MNNFVRETYHRHDRINSAVLKVSTSSSTMTTSNFASESTECLPKSTSTSDLTDMTDIPSDNDSVSEENTATSSLDESNRLRELDQNDGDVSGSRRRVRFSIVYTREFDVIVENEASRQFTSLDSTLTFTDTESDIETHISEKKQRRKERYVHLIQRQINRVENDNEQQNHQELKREGKKGFRSRILKPMWKGFLEAASRPQMVMPMPGF